MERSPSSSPSEPAPCCCPAPDAQCRRANLPMVGRLWQLCAGVHCSAAQSAAYRRLWDQGRATHRPMCIFVGSPTGETQLCNSCRGRVALKLFACNHAAHAAKPRTTLPACHQCPDYQLICETAR